VRADGPLHDAVVRLAAEAGGVGVDDVVLAPTSSGAAIAMAGDVVLKVHRDGTDPGALGARLRLAAAPAWRDCLLAPLGTSPTPVPGGGAAVSTRWVTSWPRVETLVADPSAVPWEEAGALLARLHARGVPRALSLPGHGAVARVRRSLAGLAGASSRGAAARLDLASARRVVERAAAALPEASWVIAPAGRPRTVVHGDWHLGQLGRRGATAPWLLIDPDDLGVGDPAWDFARPAALLAAGFLAPRDWVRLVDGYRAAGGPALPLAPADPWPALDAVARAGLVQGAAAALRHAAEDGRALDEGDEALVEACAASARG
jgi:aminoglycoside phosphotransferase (APT) family kinase protein